MTAAWWNSSFSAGLSRTFKTMRRLEKQDTIEHTLEERDV